MRSMSPGGPASSVKMFRLPAPLNSHNFSAWRLAPHGTSSRFESGAVAHRALEIAVVSPMTATLRVSTRLPPSQSVGAVSVTSEGTSHVLSRAVPRKIVCVVCAHVGAHRPLHCCSRYE